MGHYYVVVRFIFSFHLFMFTVQSSFLKMATNTNPNNLFTDVTMASLLAEVQDLKSELSTLQARDSFHNLSLDERGRERHHPASGQSFRPHNTKIQYFANLPGENFLAWRSQFQVIASYHRWSDNEAKQLVYAYMKGTALESVMDISLTGPKTIGQVLDSYQDRFLPECDSQLLRAQFACVVQMPNESVQKLHARMMVLYHLAYPNKGTLNEVYLIEKFISALNNREVQNYVRRRKPTTYAKALSITNEETSFVLMDIATHAPGGLQAPVPGDNSFIATLSAKRTDSGRHLAAKTKCCYGDKEGHIKERCPIRLKDFLKQPANQRNRKPSRPTTSTANKASRAASPARRKQQTLPIVADSYGPKHVAALEGEGDTLDTPDCSDLLEGEDLATLDEATVVALYEELQEPELTDGETDFPDGQ